MRTYYALPRKIIKTPRKKIHVLKESVHFAKIPHPGRCLSAGKEEGRGLAVEFETGEPKILPVPGVAVDSSSTEDNIHFVVAIWCKISS